MNINNKTRIIGETSIPPRFGTIFLIGFSSGSVSLLVATNIITTNLFCILTILNAINQLKIIFAIYIKININRLIDEY